jgi:hypothetical protein
VEVDSVLVLVGLAFALIKLKVEDFLFRAHLPGANGRFKFDKRSQLFIRTHNEMLFVTVRVHGEHRSPLRIHGGYAAPTPTGFAQIVTDDFPVLHAMDSASFSLHTAMTK